MKAVINTKKARILMVLPTLGERPTLLRKSLESIKAQAPTLYDIVMVYPLKNKQTAELAKEFGAASVEDPGGISAAINLGISQAKSWHEFIGWVGDDDLVAPDSLSIGINALDSFSDAVVAFGYCEYINDDGRKLFINRAGRFAPWLMTWGPNLVPFPGTVFRKSALLKAGRFDESNKYSMDLDMFLRLRKLGKFINTKRVMASFRWHVSSTTVANRKAVLKETEAVKRKHLPKSLRYFSPIWNTPVHHATRLAAYKANKMAGK